MQLEIMVVILVNSCIFFKQIASCYCCYKAVCLSGLLGSVAPCVLHGSNVERLNSNPASFANNCLPYAGLYVLGNCFFGWNCLAPWYSYPNRTAIRHKFNIEVSLLFNGVFRGNYVSCFIVLIRRPNECCKCIIYVSTRQNICTVTNLFMDSS